jgi:hypothetical protein
VSESIEIKENGVIILSIPVRKNQLYRLTILTKQKELDIMDILKNKA